MKDRLKALISKIQNFEHRIWINAVAFYGKHVGLSLTVAALLAFSMIKAPSVYRSYLRSSVGKHIYYVANAEGTHGGTGFSIQAPSGKVYILTNSHVCDGVGEANMFISNGSGRGVPAHIVENSRDTDLCLLSSIAGDSGLSLGSEPSPGDELYTMGHPHLMPSTLTQGELIGSAVEEVPLFMIETAEDAARCNMPKMVVRSFNFFIFSITACCEHINAYVTTAPILPGSSGSPVFTSTGKVVAVMFAGNSDGPGWGSAVSYGDLMKFLQPY